MDSTKIDHFAFDKANEGIKRLLRYPSWRGKLSEPVGLGHLLKVRMRLLVPPEVILIGELKKRAASLDDLRIQLDNIRRHIHLRRQGWRRLTWGNRSLSQTLVDVLADASRGLMCGVPLQELSNLIAE